MGSNSIRSNLSKNEIITEIKMTSSAYKSGKGKKLIAVIVEGMDDASFLNGKFASDVAIYESFSGKTGVVEILDYFDDNSNIIGICDKDYDEAVLYNGKLFCYDFCCLEMMIVSNEDVFDAIANELYRGNLTNIELKNRVFGDLKWLSFFRKLNHHHNWGIKIEGISISNAFDDKYLQIDNSILKENIIRVNGNRQIDSRFFDTVNQELEKVNSNCSEAEYTQGHDFIHCLKCYCDGHEGERQRSTQEISSIFRCSFQKEQFSYTFLYRDILSYQQRKMLNFLEY